MKVVRNTGVLTGKHYEDFRRKKITCCLDQKPPWKTRPLNAATDNGLCKEEEKTEEKLKKTFRLKLLELCKSRTERSSPDMFNIYVVLACHDMVTDIAGLSRAGANSKAQHY